MTDEVRDSLEGVGLGEVSTIILCGGRGTRAYPLTVEVPKPLLDVAGHPILEHVMRIYAGQGATRFVLAAGYKIEMIRAFAETLPEEWCVQVLDTGEDSDTGTRVLRCREFVDESFFVTYGDGVGNVDLSALFQFHGEAGGAATITTGPLPSQYGTIEIDEHGVVRRFKEKPLLWDHWINCGFFVMNQSVFDEWGGDNLEVDVLPSLAQAGKLRAFRHRGFWKSMDTYKDALDLTGLAAGGSPPWLEPPF